MVIIDVAVRSPLEFALMCGPQWVAPLSPSFTFFPKAFLEVPLLEFDKPTLLLSTPRPDFYHRPCLLNGTTQGSRSPN